MGEPVRLALAQSGVEWVDNRVQGADWPALKASKCILSEIKFVDLAQCLPTPPGCRKIDQNFVIQDRRGCPSR